MFGLHARWHRFRCWLFPATVAERKDSAAQPTNYAGFDPELLALILAKEPLLKEACRLTLRVEYGVKEKRSVVDSLAVVVPAHKACM